MCPSLCHVCLSISPFAKAEWSTVRFPYKLVLNDAISLIWVDLNEKVSVLPVGTHLRLSRIPTNDPTYPFSSQVPKPPEKSLDISWGNNLQSAVHQQTFERKTTLKTFLK